jgi:hypothetical protein
MSRPAKQLTLRGFDEELATRIRGAARERGVSLNRAALALLRKGAGLGPPGDRGDVVGTALDHLVGTWTAQDEREIRTALRWTEVIDPELWAPSPRPRRGRGR